MFLNDAFDIEFDRQHRPERPIVSGLASARAVWLSGFTWLVGGWTLLACLGQTSGLFAVLLVALILIYDAFHKRTALAPILMASCRFVLYLVAASATAGALTRNLVWHGLVLGAYILGLSLVARAEAQKPPQGEHAQGPSGGGRCSTHIRRTQVVATVFLAVPLAYALASPKPSWQALASGTLLGSWLVWSLVRCPAPKLLSPGAAGLLAGIVLVDWLAVAESTPALGLVFGGLFWLALVLQRDAPAT